MGSRRDPVTGKTRRGCSNGNDRGNTKARRQRKEWLLETYPANDQMIRIEYWDGSVAVRTANGSTPDTIMTLNGRIVVSAEYVPTTRCYRCGDLLWWETLTIDCIFPRALGGLYGTVLRDKREKRTNLRPACAGCNSFTGGPLATVKKAAAKKIQNRKQVT